ncbi:hypothetical protein J6590_077917 [Homalodisca vitripennis]|nr:hypothetical protein J6590_077917 [Homalodisca vitripennis]
MILYSQAEIFLDDNCTVYVEPCLPLAVLSVPATRSSTRACHPQFYPCLPPSVLSVPATRSSTRACHPQFYPCLPPAVLPVSATRRSTRGCHPQIYPWLPPADLSVPSTRITNDTRTPSPCRHFPVYIRIPDIRPSGLNETRHGTMRQVNHCYLIAPVDITRSTLGSLIFGLQD